MTLPMALLAAGMAAALHAQEPAATTATFYADAPIRAPYSGDPITLYTVHLLSPVARTVNPIDVFRAYPGCEAVGPVVKGSCRFVPLTREQAVQALELKAKRHWSATALTVMQFGGDAATITTALQAVVPQGTPDQGARRNLYLSAGFSALTTFVVPAIQRAARSEAPEYKLPDDLLSAAPIRLETGVAVVVTIATRGEALPVATGVVR